MTCLCDEVLKINPCVVQYDEIKIKLINKQTEINPRYYLVRFACSSCLSARCRVFPVLRSKAPFNSKINSTDFIKTFNKHNLTVQLLDTVH